MGCKQSRPGVSPQQAVQKCLRPGCDYVKHTQQGHGFCCFACKDHGVHGPVCEKRLITEASAAPVTVTAPRPLPTAKDADGLRWQPSLLFGPQGLGIDNKEVTATETMHIVAHKGELFASFGLWMSPAFVAKKPEKHNFIGRLSSKDGKWQVDMRSQGSSKFAVRMTCLKSVTFTRDCHGKELTPPVEQLTACYCLGKHGNMILGVC